MSSMISYFNDRVLTPEMMRAMIILYIGPHNRPDFASDYLLCPILAPDVLLARFPKTYFLTGERDPLVDDTVIFSGRLRRVKAAMHASGGTRLEVSRSRRQRCRLRREVRRRGCPLARRQPRVPAVPHYLPPRLEADGPGRAVDR